MVEVSFDFARRKRQRRSPLLLRTKQYFRCGTPRHAIGSSALVVTRSAQAKVQLIDKCGSVIRRFAVYGGLNRTTAGASLLNEKRRVPGTAGKHDRPKTSLPSQMLRPGHAYLPVESDATCMRTRGKRARNLSVRATCAHRQLRVTPARPQMPLAVLHRQDALPAR
jgi:hypothetical protein